MSELSEAIIEMHSDGKSYSQIKEALGCSKGTISYHLGKGQKEKTFARTRDRRSKIRKYLQQIRQDGICADCKEDYPYWMMEFDHLEDKLFNLSGPVCNSKTLEEIQAEIAKCDLVCANCHANRTHIRALKSNDNVLDVSRFY